MEQAIRPEKLLKINPTKNHRNLDQVIKDINYQLVKAREVNNETKAFFVTDIFISQNEGLVISRKFYEAGWRRASYDYRQNVFYFELP